MNKTISIIAGFILIFFAVIAKAQDNTDYFTGHWNVLVEGTPNGDVTMVIILEQKDGNLAGTIKTEGMESTKFDNIEEEDNAITLYWISGEYNVRMYLEKVDENKLTGNLMDMFEASGDRILEEITEETAKDSTDYFIGRWNAFVEGTPNGDVNLNINLERKEGILVGTISTEGMEKTAFDHIEEEDDAITLYWIAGEYNVRMYLERVDMDNLTGNMMDMFEASGVRITERVN